MPEGDRPHVDRILPSPHTREWARPGPGPRATGQLLEEVLHHALHVLQHQRRVRLCEQERLQLLVVQHGADAHDDDTDPGTADRKVYLKMCRLRNTNQGAGPALAVYGCAGLS